MRDKVVFVILSVLLLCIIVYIAASLLSIQTVDAAAMQVVSYQKNDEQIKMTVGIGVSSHVLVSYDYQIDHNYIYVKVKQAPVWSLFFFKHAQLEIAVPNDSEKDFNVYLVDDRKQIEIAE